MYRNIKWLGLAGAFLILVGSFFGGCSRSKRVTGVASVATYSVIYIDSFTTQDREELLDSIANVFSAIQSEPDVINNITNVDNSVTVNVTNTVVETTTVVNNNVLIESGENNSCPHLYEKLLRCFIGNERFERDSERHRNRCRQLSEDNCNRHRRDR